MSRWVTDKDASYRFSKQQMCAPVATFLSFSTPCQIINHQVITSVIFLVPLEEPIFSCHLCHLKWVHLLKKNSEFPKQNDYPKCKVWTLNAPRPHSGAKPKLRVTLKGWVFTSFEFVKSRSTLGRNGKCRFLHGTITYDTAKESAACLRLFRFYGQL